MGDAWQEIRRLADEQVRTIMRYREAYVSAWVAETGLLPSECEIVETRSDDGLTVTVRVQRRGDPTRTA